MPNIVKYILQISNYHWLVVDCTCHIRQISSISTLQNWQRLKKYVSNTRIILETNSIIKKSTKKKVIALDRNSIHLLLHMYSCLYNSFSNLIQLP